MYSNGTLKIKLDVAKKQAQNGRWHSCFWNVGDVNDDDAIDGAYHIPMDGARGGERMRASRILFWVLGQEWRPQAVRAPASAWEEVLSVQPGTEAK